MRMHEEKPMSSREGRSAEERRRSQREPIKIPIDYSAVDVFFSEFASNINEGGMFIETDNPAELDELVQLQMLFPELEAPVQVGGRVAWTSDGKDGSPPGMGIEFHDLSPEACETINQIVCRLRTES
jgi:type IV pilus assembly protein PilZ